MTCWPCLALPCSQRGGDHPQHHVTDVVAEGVIDLLEGVDVSDNAAQFGLHDSLCIEESLEAAPVADTGEGVVFEINTFPDLLCELSCLALTDRTEARDTRPDRLERGLRVGPGGGEGSAQEPRWAPATYCE